MFSYYGSKSKIVALYSKARYNTIIEPFAGAACYSLLYSNHQCLLNEKYNKIYGIWNWLINCATKDEILSNRDFYAKEDVSSLNICHEHRALIGFCINRGSAAPRNIVQKWCCQVKDRPTWASTTYYRLTKIAESLDSIKHWKSTLGSYEYLENQEATWFIDPPYQSGGEHYIEHSINYSELADWCKSRKGQVIVCENSDAKWLPFKALTHIHGQSKKTTECVYEQ